MFTTANINEMDSINQMIFGIGGRLDELTAYARNHMAPMAELSSSNAWGSAGHTVLTTQDPMKTPNITPVIVSECPLESQALQAVDPSLRGMMGTAMAHVDDGSLVLPVATGFGDLSLPKGFALAA